MTYTSCWHDLHKLLSWLTQVVDMTCTSCWHDLQIADMTYTSCWHDLHKLLSWLTQVVDMTCTSCWHDLQIVDMTYTSCWHTLTWGLWGGSGWSLCWFDSGVSTPAHIVWYCRWWPRVPTSWRKMKLTLEMLLYGSFLAFLGLETKLFIKIDKTFYNDHLYYKHLLLKVNLWIIIFFTVL